MLKLHLKAKVQQDFNFIEPFYDTLEDVNLVTVKLGLDLINNIRSTIIKTSLLKAPDKTDCIDYIEGSKSNCLETCLQRYSNLTHYRVQYLTKYENTLMKRGTWDTGETLAICR